MSQTGGDMKSIDALRAYLDECGIAGPIVDKLFQFAASDKPHHIPGGGQKEKQQLRDGSRLAAWIDEPYAHFSFIKHSHCNVIVFRKKDLDVVQLLLDTKFLTPESDIINGLVFGYHPDSVRSFALMRHNEIEAKKILKKRFGITTKSLVFHDGTTTKLNGTPRMLRRIQERLEGRTETFYDDSNCNMLLIRTEHIDTILSWS